MTSPYCFHYRFHPVGQGLFADGNVRIRPTHEPALRWVYDCGTISKDRLLQDGLTRLQADAVGRRLDLLVLSHFDNDHISGVSRLLGQCPVDMLLLPYLPLWQRLVIAFEEDLSPTAEQMRFYVNPVEYLASIPGANIRRIVFVLSSGENGPEIPTGDPDGRGNHPPDDYLEFDPGEPDDYGEADHLATAGQAAGVSVEFLRDGGAIRKRSLWEFVPYNDAKPYVFDKAFLEAAAKLRDKLLVGASKKARTARLKELKKHYEAVRKPGEQRNDISLFMYAGPIYTAWMRANLLCEWFSPRTMPEPPVSGYMHGRSYITSPRCSIPYPGDGFVDTPHRLNRLKNYLRSARTTRIGVLQVMHHGAKGNWHAGVAGSFAPILSVFSSDPKRKPHHPHRPVLNDFSNYRPVQVDKIRGLEVLGRLRR